MDRMNILLVNSVNIAMKKTEVLLVEEIHIEVEVSVLAINNVNANS